MGAVAPRHFCVAGAALGDICLRFTWQVWHLATSTFVSRGRRGTYGVARLGAVAPRPFCVAGVALGDICRRFTWQAWHLATSTVVSRGRRGTWQHPPSFRVAGVALMARLGPLDATALLRGRYGTWRHPPSLCVAGVALGDIDLRLAWLTWHFWDSAGAGRVSHTTLSHTTLSTQLCHTHHLSHTSFSHPTV